MNQSANKSDQTVKFTQKDARRIAGCVRSYESSRRSRNPSRLPRASGGGGEGGGAAVSTATFLGSWLQGTEKVVYYTATPSTSTVTVMNYTHDIVGSGAQTLRVGLIAESSEGGYVLIGYAS